MLTLLYVRLKIHSVERVRDLSAVEKVPMRADSIVFYRLDRSTLYWKYMVVVCACIEVSPHKHVLSFSPSNSSLWWHTPALKSPPMNAWYSPDSDSTLAFKSLRECVPVIVGSTSLIFRRSWGIKTVHNWRIIRWISSPCFRAPQQLPRLNWVPRFLRQIMILTDAVFLCE